MSNQRTGTGSSRARNVRAAVRKPTKARLMISGPSGSGKTWTALDIATVLAPGGRIVFVDSEPSDDENTAAELYADQFAFALIDWRKPPFDPRDLAATIRDLGASPDRPDVVIVDSASPFWGGSGGTLDIAGGRYQGWQTATPAQDELVAAILSAPFHVIVCTRAKQDYAMEEGSDGKTSVRKLGLAPIQRSDLEYEFQVVLAIDVEHRIDVGKTRCSDLAGKSYHANDQQSFAEVYKSWLSRGTTVLRMADVDLIVAAFGRIVDEAERAVAKRRFGTEIGRPDHLDVEQLPAAWAWLSENLGVPAHRYVDDGEGSYACSSCGLTPSARWHSDSADVWTPGAPRSAESPEEESPFDDVPGDPAPEPAPVPEPPETAPEASETASPAPEEPPAPARRRRT